jgi:hypothetical protein
VKTRYYVMIARQRTNTQQQRNCSKLFLCFQRRHKCHRRGICEDVRIFFSTALLNCHYQQSQRPTDSSPDSREGGKDKTGRQIKTTVHCSSVLYIVRNRTHVHIPILWPLRILTFPPGTFCIASEISTSCNSNIATTDFYASPSLTYETVKKFGNI